ncbi:MAG: sigma-70 family RNA polymerase sigma factor [Holophagaceae bacterium]|nr:sigma-70 family RNA polymerase sigma factor [Holophagaceae bacterium]
MSAPRLNEESEDVELVSACRSGGAELSERAFEWLVRRHQKAMLNLAYRVVGDYDEACEVVQDAFVAAYKNLAAFRGEAKFSTWLTTITLNQARNGLVRIKARRSHEAYSLDAARQTDDGELRQEPPSQAPSALEQMEETAMRRKIEACIAELPQDFREVLVLRDLQEHSYEEIGAMLKVREGTVKSRLFRAREGIKDCLKRAMGAP